MRRLFSLVCFICAAACRCDGGVNQVEAGFAVEEKELDFGRVLEGTRVRKSIHVSATTVASISLALATDAPFSVQETVDLSGGANGPVEVVFTAGSRHEERLLTITSEKAVVSVTLKGTGVHPLDCVPSVPCRTSRFVLETNSCSESVLPDGSDCTPTSTCLERGQCLGGLCQGVARSCNDNNECTIDGCAEGIGCVNLPRTCPNPTAACKVATCDPGTGCGEMQAPDFTPCGTVDCISAHLCAAGVCGVTPTPDGFPCSPPTPCQGRGTCQSQVCKRPDAGIMTPELVLPIGGAPPVSRPMLLSFAGQLFGQVCGVPLPPVALDGGLDADGGRLDGGLVDGGFGCALLSYTNNGFVRFTEPFGDARERALLNVSNLGAALLDDGGLEVRSLADGKLRLFTPLEGAVHPRGVASAVDARPWFLSAVPDAGVSLWRVEWEDAGQVTRVREGLDASVSLLALDERGNAWVSGGGVVGYLEVDDAGRAGEPRWSPATAPLTDTLATGGGFAFGGATQFVASAPDAGLIPAVGWLDDAGQPLRVQERFSLVSQQRAFVFYRQCPSPLMSCGAEDDELWLRQLELATGNVLDDARLSPPFRDARVVEASLLELSGYPPGVMSLIQLHRDGGAAAYLQLSVGSAGDLTCPLPEQSDVAGAAIGAGYLWVYGNRDGGPYALEAYPLTGVPLSGSAWPLADGVAGQRRAR